MNITRHVIRKNALCWSRRSLLSLTVLVSTVTTPVFANGFLLAPTRVFFEGSARAQEVTIMNQTDRTQTYRMRFEDRRLKEDGEYEVIIDPADVSGAAAMLRLSVRQVTVPARSSATVRVLLRKPAALTSGEVRSHLIFTELPVVKPAEAASDAGGGISIAITTVFGISIPILVRTGDLSARVTRVVAKRVALPDLPQLENIDVRLESSGNKSIFVDLRLVNTRQRRGEPIAAARGVSIYAPVNARTITIGLNAEQTAKLRASSVVLQYQEVNKDGLPIGSVSEVAF